MRASVGIHNRPLKELVELSDSGTWGDEGVPEQDSPVLRSTNIAENRLSLLDPAWRSLPTNDLDRRRLVTGDILVTKSSGSPDHIGKCAIFRDPGNGHAYYFSNFMLRLRAKKEEADPRWLHYWLTSDRGRFILKQMNSTTTGLRNLNVGQYLQQCLPAPPPSEQKRIADILDKADAIRRKRREEILAIDKLIYSQFVLRFGDPVSNSKRFPQVPLARYGRVTTGNTPPRNDLDNYGDAIEWIKSDNINTRYHWITKAIEGLSEKGVPLGRTVTKGSTLVTCIAGSRDCVGNAALTDRTVAFNQQINAITPLQSTDPFFLYGLVLLSKPLVQRASTESMKGMVSKRKFEQLQVIDVPPDAQKDFGKVLSRILVSLDNQYAAEKESNKLFDSLVQRAFRGDL